jgi:hypothetical protein
MIALNRGPKGPREMPIASECGIIALFDGFAARGDATAVKHISDTLAVL